MAVAVDARKIGSPARFARRSCHPNTQLKHVIRYGKLHLFLVATEDIDFSAEVKKFGILKKFPLL
jgi:SET domain-containing protein